MKPITESLSRFERGQMEVQNKVENCLLRGQIETIVVEDNTVTVKFAWLEKRPRNPPNPGRWVKDDNLDYGASLEIYSVANISNGRISMYSKIVGELVVLSPTGVSRLGPSKVEGLWPSE